MITNGVHTIYVNGSYRGEDAIGHLMHNFSTPNADDMYYREIAKTVRFHKQEEGGGKLCAEHLRNMETKSERKPDFPLRKN
ncbi:MAG: hypothetical protein II811_00575 [Spirochaetaceae bacterium]|nr:hypothetical protein [Spirochaetaceae bacterium]